MKAELEDERSERQREDARTDEELQDHQERLQRLEQRASDFDRRLAQVVQTAPAQVVQGSRKKKRKR